MSDVPNPPPGGGPVEAAATPAARRRPLGGNPPALSGFWGRWQQVNAEVTIPQGAERLEAAGNIENFRRVAAGDTAYKYPGPLFLDSDVYKWLEAVAWEYGRAPSTALLASLDGYAAVIAAAQDADGYLNTYVQLGHAERYADLPWSHELYCGGHLIQAAVAAYRTAGHTVLLEVARRFADHLLDTFGTDRRHDIDGHPVIETALVELYRTTQHRPYLELAAYFVEARGHRLNDRGSGRAAYFSDRVPVRDATSLEGHAVRAVYFAAGATDLALETGDDTLTDALSRQWEATVASKTYLTGGMGSRWEGESFGAPYELAPDRCYCETCAAVGSVQWSWRMLLATGDVRYADLIERTLFNAVLPGLSLAGDAFFYVNTLQLREGTVADDARDPINGRRPWFGTACCPPNIMRMLASVGSYLATQDDTGLQVHQYAAGRFRADLARGAFTLEVTTDYPWSGDVELLVQAAPDAEIALALRVPTWCAGATLDGEPLHPVDGYATIRRRWRSGDRLRLALPGPARLTTADDRIDAIRGSVAIERGPLVYCLEQADQPAGPALGDVRLDAGPLSERWRADLLGGVVTVTARDAGGRELVAVPYFGWANRGAGPMRVWIPAGTPMSIGPAPSPQFGVNATGTSL
ncbi:MAG: glycoside hydrolase family 127 protein [Mycobacteriales bacterium]